MASAIPIPTAPEDSASPESVQERISRNARVLMAAAGVDQKGISEALAQADSTVSRKFNQGQRWTPEDLDVLAAFFSTRLSSPVEPGIFFRPGGLLDLRTGSIATPFALIEGSGDATPARRGHLSVV